MMLQEESAVRVASICRACRARAIAALKDAIKVLAKHSPASELAMASLSTLVGKALRGKFAEKMLGPMASKAQSVRGKRLRLSNNERSCSRKSCFGSENCVHSSRVHQNRGCFACVTVV